MGSNFRVNSVGDQDFLSEVFLVTTQGREGMSARTSLKYTGYADLVWH